MKMTKRLSAVVGEYNDKQTNQQKAEWASIGVIGASSKGKEYMLLDPTINLAGVLLKQNILAANKGEKLSDMVMVSIIDEQNQTQNQTQNQGGYQQQNNGFQQQPPANYNNQR